MVALLQNAFQMHQGIDAWACAPEQHSMTYIQLPFDLIEGSSLSCKPDIDPQQEGPPLCVGFAASVDLAWEEGRQACRAMTCELQASFQAH